MVDAKIPDFALPYGFLLNPRGALTAGTIRLKELSLLIDSTSIEAPYEELRRIGVEENALLKDTHYTRVRAFRCLRDFYALDLQLPVYRVFRELWEHDSAERPLLALLLASAREPIIRATAPYILRRRAGDRVDPADLEEVLGAEFPGQYSETSLRRLGQHLASAYQQSGHLSGKVNKVRSKATSGPASTAYALFLGYLCGVRGAALFGTLWAELLDSSRATAQGFAAEASRHAWLEYRHVADVIDITFSQYQPLIKDPEDGQH